MQIVADLATMPRGTIALIYGGAYLLVVLLAIAIVVLVRMLRIGYIGPIKMEQRGQVTMHDMDNETKKLEDAGQREIRRITNNLKLNISNVFVKYNVCTFAKLAIATSLRFPLYEAIANNHYTSELAFSYEAYRDRMIEQIREEYISLYSASKTKNCNSEELSTWEEISGLLIGCIDIWLRNICRESLRTCERQLTILKKFLSEFEASKDNYRAKVAESQIKEKDKCVASLRMRLGLTP